MIIIKTTQEIERMRSGGRILGGILKKLAQEVHPGIVLEELEIQAINLIEKAGAEPAFKGYKNHADDLPFSAALCASVNQELVHCPADRKKILKSGDILSLDLGIKYKGLFTDAALTIGVGQINAEAKKLIKVTRRSLELGIKQVKPGHFLADISGSIQKYVEAEGFEVVKNLVGHGVGREVHEEPRIPNFLAPNQPKIKLKEGMTLAIEPMVNVGSDQIKTLDDGWMVETVNGKLCAHFEHTVVVTKRGAEVLTYGHHLMTSHSITC